MRIVLLTLALVGAAGAASAQDEFAGDNSVRARADAPGRYEFNHVDKGILRLDNNTGQVSLCSQHATGWACDPVPEERAALEKEIARLQDEVAALKKEVASLREPPPPVPPLPVPPPAGKNDEFSRNLHDDIARARGYLQWTWRQVVNMIDKIQKGVTGNG